MKDRVLRRSLFFDELSALLTCHAKFHRPLSANALLSVKSKREVAKSGRPDIITAPGLAIITVKYHLCVGIRIDIAYRLFFFFLSAWRWCITGILVFLLRLHSFSPLESHININAIYDLMLECINRTLLYAISPLRIMRMLKSGEQHLHFVWKPNHFSTVFSTDQVSACLVLLWSSRFRCCYSCYLNSIPREFTFRARSGWEKMWKRKTRKCISKFVIKRK